MYDIYKYICRGRESEGKVFLIIIYPNVRLNNFYDRCKRHYFQMAVLTQSQTEPICLCRTPWATPLRIFQVAGSFSNVYFGG